MKTRPSSTSSVSLDGIVRRRDEQRPAARRFDLRDVRQRSERGRHLPDAPARVLGVRCDADDRPHPHRIVAYRHAARPRCCGGDDEPPTTTFDTDTTSTTTTETTPAETTKLRVYFLLDGKVQPVAREVPKTPAVARAALDELADGPTTSEGEPRSDLGRREADPDDHHRERSGKDQR